MKYNHYIREVVKLISPFSYSQVQIDELEEHDIQAFRGSEQNDDININIKGWLFLTPVTLYFTTLLSKKGHLLSPDLLTTPSLVAGADNHW